MKVNFKNMVKGYSGKCDGLVYYYDSRAQRMCVRRHTKQKITEHNHTFGSITKHLATLQLSQVYKDDFYLYTGAYNSLKANRQNQASSWYNLYIKSMHAMAKQLSIDLLTITRAEIITNDYPCRTVARLIAAGFLPEIRDWEYLNHEM